MALVMEREERERELKHTQTQQQGAQGSGDGEKRETTLVFGEKDGGNTHTHKQLAGTAM